MLSNRQIERYSRQIIAPGFGGAAQERLLASRIMVIGELDDVDPVLAYLVGAGVGQIDLQVDADPATIASLAIRFRDANPDVKVAIGREPGSPCDLLIALAADQAIADEAHALAAADPRAAIVYARLDATPMIAIIRARPPCLECADLNFKTPFAGRCDNPDLVAMVAALETIKMLTGIASAAAMLIKINGYAASASPLGRRPDQTACPCPPAEPR